MEHLDISIMGIQKEQQSEKIYQTDLSKEQVVCGERYTFQPRKLFDNKLQMLLPEIFHDMPEDIKSRKYLFTQKPDVILTPFYAISYLSAHRRI